MTAWVEDGGLMVEGQGPFAPENLPDIAEDTVFSRRFTDGKRTITVYASPTVPIQYQETATDYAGPIPEYGYEVEMCTEIYDPVTEDSDYEWEYVNHYGVTLEAAIEDARGCIERLKAENF